MDSDEDDSNTNFINYMNRFEAYLRCFFIIMRRHAFLCLKKALI